MTSPAPPPLPTPSLRITASADDTAAIEALTARASDERVPRRLWDRDDTLWGPAGQAEVSDRLAWLDAPDTTRTLTDELVALTEAVAAEGYTDVLLVGMGGSSLAPAVICSADPQAPRRLRMLDSTDPDAIASVDAATDPDRTLVLVSTKSGGTIETISLFRHFWSRRPDGAAFVAVTDPDSGLEDLARRHGFRAIFRADPEIGGRYSALSPFGIVPAALIGLDHETLLAGGQAGLDAARADVADNAAVRLGAAIAALVRAGRDKLVVRVQDPDLGHFSLWLEQLVAESTGKHGIGVLPVVDDPGAEIIVRDLTGSDRQLLVIRGSEPDQGLDDELATAIGAGVPVLELVLDHDPERAPLAQLGWAFATTEVAVAVAGWGLAINPFDQPDVQAAKDATQAVLASLIAGEPLQHADDASADAIAAFASGLRAPGYLALLAYVPPSPTGAAAIERLRAVLTRRTDAAITAAFGPRYLHSTGQLHKGGPAGGRFLILEHEPRATRAIPADPDSHPDHPTDSFAALIGAQAEGDERTLAAHDRAVLRLNLGTDWLERLDEIVGDLEGRSS